MYKIITLMMVCFAASPVNAQQNTILIIADDVSPDYFGYFSTTTDTANAPNIRALASRGVAFTKVWSAPVCSPARAGILTGRYPFRTGVGGVITSPASPQIDTVEMSIAKLLKYYAPVSYNTACIGKWHLNANTPLKRSYPNKLGFDLYSGNFNGAIPNYYSYVRIKNGTVDTVTTYATTQTVNDAIDWMDTMNTGKPFFLWLAFNAPHDPFHIPPATLCDTSGLIGTPADISAYPEKYFKAAIEAMDSEIGRLLTYLDAHNLGDSTNIIFIGDNGNQGQVVQISSSSKAKGTIYNYGVSVPMICAGPAVVNGNRKSNELISTTDLFATIAELCGFQNWKGSIPVTTTIDSRSFLPIIKNQTAAKRAWIFAETFNSPATSEDGKTIRNQDYHLLRFDNSDEEFYNQTADVYENNNLLLNISAMTATDLFNYYSLCDSISTLTGISGCNLTSVKETIQSNEMAVYPNPATSIITIAANGDYEMKINITDIYGQLRTSFMVNSVKNTIDLSAFPSGVYVLSSNFGMIAKVIRE